MISGRNLLKAAVVGVVLLLGYKFFMALIAKVPKVDLTELKVERP